MSALTVRLYNVGFGEAILISVPDRDGRRENLRHILIDLGNLLASDPTVFTTLASDIMQRTAGRGIDLYVMTHEHLDHVQGLKYLADNGHRLPIDYVWLTASAHPRYGTKFPETKKAMDSHRQLYDRLRVVAESRGLLSLRAVHAFFVNNDYRRTSSCVDEIRRAAAVRTCYVHRRFPLRVGRDHPFVEARLRVLAPEHNTSVYYGLVRPVMGAGETSVKDLASLETPSGVDEAAFANLVRHLSTGLGDRMLAIDKARNDTSVVLQLEWRGWRLLFTGDAEERSWRLMHRPEARRLLRPIHFLKVAHHGSRTGMPSTDILDAILPIDPPDGRERYAAVSTYGRHWASVPDEESLAEVASRVTELFDTRDVGSGQSTVIVFPSPGGDG